MTATASLITGFNPSGTHFFVKSTENKLTVIHYPSPPHSLPPLSPSFPSSPHFLPPPSPLPSYLTSPSSVASNQLIYLSEPLLLF